MSVFVGMAFFSSFGLPVVLDHEVHEIRSRTVGLPISMDAEARKKCVCVRIWVSEDRGTIWKRIAEMPPKATAFEFTAPRDGHFWFALQTEWRDSKTKLWDFDDTKKVYINANRLPVVRPQVAGKQLPTQVDEASIQRLQREIADLRSTIEELRKQNAALEKKLLGAK